jgi:hypothetical protein
VNISEAIRGLATGEQIKLLLPRVSGSLDEVSRRGEMFTGTSANKEAQPDEKMQSSQNI